MSKYSKEILEEVVKNNVSIYGVMKELRGNVPISGSLHKYIKDQIVKFGIDTSHFTGRGSNRGENHVGGFKKLSWEQILVFHRSEDREDIHKLRRALLESGRLHICEVCGINTWHGKFLQLEIHHKNGDGRDNRPENLEFLCPNCHTMKT
jgi:hypothetical protein